MPLSTGLLLTAPRRAEALHPGARAARAVGSIPAAGWLALTAVAYVLLVGRLAILRYDRFQSSAYDLGIYVQALWLISRGAVPFDTGRGFPIPGGHLTPAPFPPPLLFPSWVAA